MRRELLLRKKLANFGPFPWNHSFLSDGNLSSVIVFTIDKTVGRRQETVSRDWGPLTQLQNPRFYGAGQWAIFSRGKYNIIWVVRRIQKSLASLECVQLIISPQDEWDHYLASLFVTRFNIASIHVAVGCCNHKQDCRNCLFCLPIWHLAVTHNTKTVLKTYQWMSFPK